MSTSTPAPRYWSPWLAAFAALWLAIFWLVCRGRAVDPAGLASEHWGLILVGFCGAVLGNATAVGGGLIFVPYMMFFYDLSAVDSLKLALATQAFGMSSGALAWMRSSSQGATHELALRLSPALLCGIVVSTVLVRPSPGLVKSLFGPVSIGIGVLMLYLALRRRSTTADGTPEATAGLAIAAVAGAALTGWAAVGVGEVVAAWMMLRQRTGAQTAVGLGVVLLALCSIVLALVHWLFLGGLPWELAGFVILGAVFGARLGPVVAAWLPPRGLKTVFGAVAIFDGILMSI
ncbi:MAG: sulfite exporter TauE/SafE family protein [Acidobacteriota bacterium]